MWVEDIIGSDGSTYQKLEIPDYATTSDIGLPEIPTVIGIVGIPDDSNVSINVSYAPYSILDNYYIWPYQKPFSSLSTPEFEKDEEFYNSNNWYPTEHAFCGEPGIFKYWTVDNVGYIPFEFNPYTRQLKVYSHIIFDVLHPNGSRIPTATMESSMAELMEATLWNFNELPVIVDDYTTVYYLIIVPDDFYDQTLPFAKWIEDHYGYITRTKKLSEVGNTYQAISSYINQFYYDNNSTDYVLFIGDTDRIPTYPVTSPLSEEDCSPYGRTIPSDFRYSLIKGGDLWSEVAIGRISFDNSEDLQYQLNKIMSYYLTPIPPNDGWRNNVLLVAHQESVYRKIADNLAGKNYSYQTPNFLKCYGEYGASNDDVKYNIDNGVSSLCYFGHGGIGSWSDWNIYNEYWTYYNIRQLNNPTKYPIAFNFTCLNGRITENYEPETLCESWMDARFSILNKIGTVTTMGFSHLHWHEFSSCEHAERLYGYIYDYENAKNKGIGWLNYTAASASYYHWINHAWEKHNTYADILLGDPGLRIRTKPSTINNLSNNIKFNKLDELKNIEIKINNPVYDSIKMFINTNKESDINIDVYDISGRKLDKLYCGKLNIGENEIEINNISLNSGLYILNIYSDNFNEVRKVVVIK